MTKRTKTVFNGFIGFMTSVIIGLLFLLAAAYIAIILLHALNTLSGFFI